MAETPPNNQAVTPLSKKPDTVIRFHGEIGADGRVYYEASNGNGQILTPPSRFNYRVGIGVVMMGHIDSLWYNATRNGQGGTK